MGGRLQGRRTPQTLGDFLPALPARAVFGGPVKPDGAVAMEEQQAK